MELTGGVAGAELHEGVLNRPAGPWTPAVHELLAYLSGRVPHIPEVLGRSETSEQLTHLPGEVVEYLSDAQLAAVAAWLRDFHDAVYEFSLEAGETLVDAGQWRFFGAERPVLIGHNDLRPPNLCFHGDELAGVFDWDLAGPTTPAMDLAYFAWHAVPLTDPDVDVAWLRLEIIAEAYGCVPEWIAEAVVPRLNLLISGIPEAVRRGDTNMQRLVDAGEPELVAAQRDTFQAEFLAQGPPVLD